MLYLVSEKFSFFASSNMNKYNNKYITLILM